MGNRAVITTAPYSINNVGIYLHWNGGPESVAAFMKACKQLGYRSPASDDSYAMARLTQAIGTFFGGSTSVGIGTVRNLDTDNGDNGVYVIGGDWEIVERKFGRGAAEPNEEIVKTIMAKLADNAKE
jgi:hypothetical protein